MHRSIISSIWWLGWARGAESHLLFWQSKIITVTAFARGSAETCQNVAPAYCDNASHSALRSARTNRGSGDSSWCHSHTHRCSKLAAV